MYLHSHFYAGPPALTVNVMENTESSSIVVQWDEVDDSLPTTYLVTWTNERNHSIRVRTLEEQSSYKIAGLTLDTVYIITVTAYNKCGTGPEYNTSVSLTYGTFSSTSTTTVTTNTMAITSTASSSTNTALTKSSTIITTASMNPSTVTYTDFTEAVDLKTSSTNPITAITSTYSVTDTMSTLSTMNPNDKTTADDNSKILSISICY